MIGASTGSYVYPRICGSFFSKLVSCFSLAPRLFPPVFFLVCRLAAAETFPKPLEYPWFFALFQAGSRGCIREFPCSRSFPFCFHHHSSIHRARYRFNIFTTETGQNLHVIFPCQIYSNSLSNDSSAYKASSFPDKIKYNKRIIHIRRISIFQHNNHSILKDEIFPWRSSLFLARSSSLGPECVSFWKNREGILISRKFGSPVSCT